MKWTFTGLVLLAVISGMPGSAALAKEGVRSAPPPSDGEYVRGEVLVKFRTFASERGKGRALGQVDGTRGRSLKRSRLEQVRLRPGADEKQALRSLLDDPSVEYAHLNWKVELLAFEMISAAMPTLTPNDLASQQWHLDSPPFSAWFATSSNPVSVDVDIDAPEGWAVMAAVFDTSWTAAVGVIDSGCGESGTYSPSTGYIPGHPDLPNSVLFANPGELPGDLTDSDSNGKIDDSNGWDFGLGGAPEDNAPEDSSSISHGTMISGILGAAWNNSIGVAGVGRDQIKVLPLAALDSFDIVAAVEYAMDLVEAGYPVRVLNMSFKTTVNGDGRDWPALRTLVRDAGKPPYNIAVVAAAGNDSSDNDDFLNRAFPAEYTRDPDITSVLAVAMTGSMGSLSDLSNYGPGSVQIAAPGEEIFSTADTTDGYGYLTGTSLATPIAGAVLGVVMAAHPDLSPAEAIDRVVSGGDYDARLAGLIQSGKRVNLAGALAPFHPYSGLAYLDSTITVAMHSDSISSSYGSIVSAALDPAWSTSPVAATMGTAGATTLVLTPAVPGIAQFTLTFGGASAPLYTYDTGPWRVTAIKPFTARIGIGETVTFTPLMSSGTTFSWSVIDSTLATIVTNGDGTGTLTGLSEGATRVSLTVDDQVADYSGQILVVPSAPRSSGGGGGCGTTAAPQGSSQWAGLLELILGFMLLLLVRQRFRVALGSTFNVQRSR